MKNQIILATLAFILLLGTINADSNWFNTSCTVLYRARSNTTTTESLFNYPMLFSINTSNSTIWNTTAGCGNFYTVNAANTTVLNHAVWDNSSTFCGNASNNMTVVVSINSTDSSAGYTDVMFYVCPLNTPNQDNRLGVARSANFSEFIVFNNNNTLTDWAGNNNYIATAGAINAPIPCTYPNDITASCINLTGAGYFKKTNATGIAYGNTPHTETLWMYPTGGGGDPQWAWYYDENNPVSDKSNGLAMYHSSTDAFAFLWKGTQVAARITGININAHPNRWQFVSSWYNGSVSNLTFNMSTVSTNQIAWSSSLLTSTLNSCIGASCFAPASRTYGLYFLHTKTNGTRSVGWLQADNSSHSFVEGVQYMTPAAAIDDVYYTADYIQNATRNDNATIHLNASGITYNGNNYMIVGNHTAGKFAMIVEQPNIVVANINFKNWSGDLLINAPNVRVANITMGTEYGIIVNASVNGTYTNLSFDNITTAGIWMLDGANNNSFTDIDMNTTGAGVALLLNNASHNTFTNIKIDSNQTGTGVSLTNYSSFNAFNNLNATNCGDTATVSACVINDGTRTDGTTFSGLNIDSTTTSAVYMYGTSGNYIQNTSIDCNNGILKAEEFTITIGTNTVIVDYANNISVSNCETRAQGIQVAHLLFDSVDNLYVNNVSGESNLSGDPGPLNAIFVQGSLGQSRNVTIENADYTLTGATGGISCTYCLNATVNNVTLHGTDTSMVGVAYSAGTNSLLTNSNIIGFASYTTQFDGTNITVVNNTIDANETSASCMEFQAVGGVIRNNTIENCSMGVHLYTIGNITIVDNRILSSAVGVRAEAGANYNNFSNNIINVTSAGFEIDAVSHSVMQYNHIYSTGYALSITSSENNTFTENNITSNQWIDDTASASSNIYTASGRGNIYYWLNGTPSWQVYNIMDTNGDNWSDTGANFPFNTTTVAEFTGSTPVDTAPYTETDWYLFCHGISTPGIFYVFGNATINDSVMNTSISNLLLNCLELNANDITIDCMNNTVFYSGSNPASFVISELTSLTGTTIKNCNLVNFTTPIEFVQSTSVAVNIENNTMNGGIILGTNSVAPTYSINITGNIVNGTIEVINIQGVCTDIKIFNNTITSDKALNFTFFGPVCSGGPFELSSGGIGNKYYFANGTPSWSVLDITNPNTTNSTYATEGADYPLSSNTTTLIEDTVLGIATDSAPYTLTNTSTNTAPVITQAVILPTNVYGYTNVMCNVTAIDNESSSITVYLEWQKNGVNQSGLADVFNVTNDTSVNPSNISSLTIGDNWSCRFRAFDGVDYSAWNSTQNVTVLNSPPAVNSVTINTAPFYANSTLVGNVSITDYESNNINITYKWYRNDILNSTVIIYNHTTPVSGNTINRTDTFVVGDNWTLEVTAFDGITNSTSVNSTTITIVNSADTLNASGLTLLPADGTFGDYIGCSFTPTSTASANITIMYYIQRGDLYTIPSSITTETVSNGSYINNPNMVSQSQFSLGLAYRCVAVLNTSGSQTFRSNYVTITQPATGGGSGSGGGSTTPSNNTTVVTNVTPSVPQQGLTFIQAVGQGTLAAGPALGQLAAAGLAYANNTSFNGVSLSTISTGNVGTSNLPIKYVIGLALAILFIASLGWNGGISQYLRYVFLVALIVFTIVFGMGLGGL